jgi:exopolyphosphatase / guanosine-5'-triphosphate,3'-diphosphate pyrophosphatase
MLLGALDLGSNSFHLLVARVDGRGRLQKVTGRKAMLRLEEAVAATGRIQPETFARALDAIGELLAVAEEHEAEDVVLAGTSALREAENGAAFATAARARYHFPVEILSGEDEGRLVYHGARSRLDELPERVGVLDLGGGSVEVAVGDGDACLFSASLPLGFLRLARTLEAQGALDPERFEKVVEHVRQTAEPLVARLRELAPRAWLLSGGTARAFGRVMGLEPGAALSTLKLGVSAQRFAALDALKLVGLGVEPARARGFGLGILVLATLAEAFGAPATRITPGGLREGILLREIGGRSTRHARVHLHHAGRVSRPSAG